MNLQISMDVLPHMANVEIATIIWQFESIRGVWLPLLYNDPVPENPIVTLHLMFVFY